MRLLTLSQCEKEDQGMNRMQGDRLKSRRPYKAMRKKEEEEEVRGRRKTEGKS